MTDSRAEPNGWQRVLRNLRQPKVLVMLLLGFSSGIPIYLVGNTLGFWMRENGIELSTIGFLSWVGLAYSLKFLWAPLVDKLDAPLLGRWLGRRRGWMLLSQLVVAAALVGMALVQPQQGQLLLAGFVARPAAGVRRARAGGGVRLGHAGHRRSMPGASRAPTATSSRACSRRPRRWAIAARCWSPMR